MKHIPGQTLKARGGKHPFFSKNMNFDITNIQPQKNGEVQYSFRNVKNRMGVNINFPTTEEADKFILQL